MAPKPLLRSRSPATKTFGEAFGAATGVRHPPRQKIRIRNNNTGGKAATVTGYAGPGFHTWPPGLLFLPPGYFLQTTEANPWTRLSRFGYLNEPLRRGRGRCWRWNHRCRRWDRG
jgi:hypothetical protein